MKSSSLRYITLFTLFMLNSAFAERPGELSIEDIMAFETIQKSHLAENGANAAFEISPDRGDGYVLWLNSDGTQIDSFPRAQSVQLSDNGNTLVAKTVPTLTIRDYGEKNEKKVKGIVVASLNGQSQVIDSVIDVTLSRDGQWVAYTSMTEEYFKKGNGKDKRIQAKGYPCTLLHLETQETRTFQNVYAMSIDSSSQFIALACAWPSGDDATQTLLVHEFEDDDTEEVIEIDNGTIANLEWRPQSTVLSFTYAEKEQDEGEFAGMVVIYDAEEDDILAEIEPLSPATDSPSGWYIPNDHNALTWTHNGRYLWFGIRPANDLAPEPWPLADEEDADTAQSIDHLVAKSTLQMWHWQDSLIAPNRKSNTSRDSKTMYQCVFDTEEWAAYSLADFEVPSVSKDVYNDITLGYTLGPYERAITWDGWRYDYYLVHVPSGTRLRVLDSARSAQIQLSPSGREFAYWADSTWHRVGFRVDSLGHMRVVDTTTLQFEYSLSDPLFDFPREVPAIGSAGWNLDGHGFSFYDKFDVYEWRPNTVLCLTNGWGRSHNSALRFSKKGKFYSSAQTLLANSYNYATRVRNIHTITLGESPTLLVPDTGEKTSIVKSVKNDSILMYVKQRFDLFPDRMLLNRKTGTSTQLTNLGQQLLGHNWGKGSLFTYVVDGDSVQGGLLLPDNYTPGTPIPTLTYFYRNYAHVALDFRAPAIKNNMCFAWYTSRGYAIFLPDIRFEIGAPGPSSVKNIEAGIRTLATMGIADTTRLGIHGHSWSGYQAAFIITQSNLFSAAIAGAPVSNMTSAYGGIRWGSGRSRQFQYERYQSRLGVSLWEDRDVYINNSPLFFADQIETPLLIMFGDKDSAVPWYQGIEMYMAMRRLNKPVWLLQYEGEKHHLAKYPNKMDFFIKMDQFFSHFVLGEEPAPWLQ